MQYINDILRDTFYKLNKKLITKLVRDLINYLKLMEFFFNLFLSFFFKVSESSGEFFLKSSELFESPVYLEEAADVLCILQAGTIMSTKIHFRYSFMLSDTM